MSGHNNNDEKKDLVDRRNIIDEADKIIKSVETRKRPKLLSQLRLSLLLKPTSQALLMYLLRED
jgi:hypothetical protein